MIKTLNYALAALLLSSAPALPAEPLPPAIDACASLLRDSERLACFDKAVAALKTGAGTTMVTAENMFGANSDTSLASPDQKGVKREELKQIRGTVTSLRGIGDGMIELELDNGQVWRQTDADVRMLVSTGDSVTIVRASLGTFRIADKTGRFARFRRVR
ncbi:MAG TPA: hypothetical protein VIV63_13705 [Steroidobacteraceae bacterium]